MKANAFAVSQKAGVFYGPSGSDVPTFNDRRLPGRRLKLKAVWKQPLLVSAPVARRPPLSPSRGRLTLKECILPDREGEYIFHLFPFDRGQDQIFLVVIWSTGRSHCHPVSTRLCANIRH